MSKFRYGEILDLGALSKPPNVREKRKWLLSLNWVFHHEELKVRVCTYMYMYMYPRKTIVSARTL